MYAHNTDVRLVIVHIIQICLTRNLPLIIMLLKRTHVDVAIFQSVQSQLAGYLGYVHDSSTCIGYESTCMWLCACL